MDKTEAIEVRAVHNNHIPKLLSYLGAGVLGLNALFLGFLGLLVFAQIFGMSIVTGIVLVIVPIGLLPFTAMWVGFAAAGWIEDVSTNLSHFEYWTKVILLFIAGLIVPYIVYWITGYITLTLAALVTNVIS